MKKTLSVFLAALVLLSVFSVSAFAAGAPKIKEVACTFDGVVVKWAASKDAINYFVYRADGKDGELDCIATTTKTSYVDKDVVEKSTYTYVVSVVKKDGSYSEPSIADGKTVKFVKPHCDHKSYKWVIDYRATVYASGKKHKECNTCHKDFGYKVIPQLRTATPVIKSIIVNPTNIVIKWSSIEGATSYNVYRKLGSSKWEYIGATSSTSYADETVKNGKTYRYTVKARNAAGLSDCVISDEVKFVLAPANVKAINTKDGIKVTWDAVKGATDYKVYRKAPGDEKWTLVAKTNKAYFADLKVTAADTYIYVVRAGNGKVYSSYYKDAAKIVRLEVPQLTTAVSTKEGIKVALNKVDGAKGFYVYRKTANSGWELIGKVNYIRSSAYLDKSTKYGVKYTYTVKAFNGDSMSYCDTTGITVKDTHK